MGVRIALAALIAVILCFEQSSMSVDAYAADMPCKDFVGMMTKKQMTGIKECAKEMKLKDGKEKAAKMTCIIKCVLIREGLLSAAGTYTQEAFDKAKEMMPGNLVDKIPMLAKCGEDSVGVVDPTDPMCKSYASMVQCLMGVLPKLCKD